MDFIKGLNLTQHVGGMLETIHELALVQTPLHLEGLHLDDVERLFQELLLVVHVDVGRAGHGQQMPD